MKSLAGGLLSLDDTGGGGCPTRNHPSHCDCLTGDADGWCITWGSGGNGGSCQCLSDNAPKCYTRAAANCITGS